MNAGVYSSGEKESQVDKGRTVRWGAAAVGAMVVATLTVPALAGVGGVPAGPQDGAPPPAGDQVVALQRDLGLTSGQVSTRLAKEAWATDTTGWMRGELGTAFAGAWLDAEARDLTIGVTNREAAAMVRAAGATPRLVGRSEADLDRLKQRLDAGSAGAGGSVTGWHVDVAANALVVTVRQHGESAASRLIASSGVPRSAVRVVVADDAPAPLFDVRGGDAFSINRRGRCSVGFSVRGGFVTAGHCGQAGSATAGFNNVAQGTIRVSSFPRDDFAMVQVNQDWTPRAVVATVRVGDRQPGDRGQRNRPAAVNVAVAGSREAPVGASVCRTGSTTGTRCGVIQARNATVRYPQGVVTGLTRTSACAEPGDSGGPFLSGNQAQGLTSGGSGNCRTGGTTFFQPINEVLARADVQLVTTGAAGDANPGTPSPTASADVSPTPSGDVSPTPGAGASCPPGTRR